MSTGKTAEPVVVVRSITGALLRQHFGELQPLDATASEEEAASWWKHYAGRIRNAMLAATPAPARAPLTDRTFRAMRSLVEAILTRADDDYMRRRLDECIAIMAEHGCEPPVPWPALGTTAEPQAARAPLTRAQINALMREAGWQNGGLRQADLSAVERVIRAAERAHGIGGEA